MMSTQTTSQVIEQAGQSAAHPGPATVMRSASVGNQEVAGSPGLRCLTVPKVLLSSSPADLTNADCLRQTFCDWFEAGLLGSHGLHASPVTDEERAAKTRELMRLQGYEPAVSSNDPQQP